MKIGFLKWTTNFLPLHRSNLKFTKSWFSLLNLFHIFRKIIGKNKVKIFFSLRIFIFFKLVSKFLHSNVNAKLTKFPHSTPYILGGGRVSIVILLPKELVGIGFWALMQKVKPFCFAFCNKYSQSFQRWKVKPMGIIFNCRGS